MTTPTQHLETFDEKFGYAHKDELKQHIIQTVISVLEDELERVKYEATINPSNDWQNGWNDCLVSQITSLSTTLSTWKALLE